MVNLYGLNSCFYDNCDKKVMIIKEKEGERPLCQNYGFTTGPRGHSRLCHSKSFDLNKTDVIFTVNTSKEV